MARNWLHVTGFGNRAQDLTLYNSPGANQYKHAWWGTMPVVTGTLREVRVYITSPSGSPTLDWAIYPSVPANGVPSGTPAASGSIPNIASAGWYTLTTDADMPVTRGQPFMIRFTCSGGTSLVVRAVPSTAYDTVFGLTPAGTYWVSADGTAWSAGGGSTYFVNPQLEFSIQHDGGTEWFGCPLTTNSTASFNMNSTSVVVGQSYQLPYPIRIEGGAFAVYPSGPPLGLLRCELRAINTSTWQPDMSANGLIDYHEAEMAWQTYSGIDNSKLIALFSQPRQVQHFAVLLRWARLDSGSFALRVSYPYDAAALSRYGVTSAVRSLYSNNGGSSWTVYTDRVTPIRFLGDPYQVSSGGGGGVFLPTTRVIM